MQSLVTDIIAKRRDRAIAIVLGTKEREIDTYLPRDAQQKLRKVILDQINELADVCVDLARALEDNSTTVLNEYRWQLVEEIHGAVMNGNQS